MIESSTDTLVPEVSEQGGAEKSQQAESEAVNWTLGGSDTDVPNGANGTLPQPSLSQSLPLHQNRSESSIFVTHIHLWSTFSLQIT